MNRAIRSLRTVLIGASLIVTVWVLWLGGATYVNMVLAGNRASVYGALAGVSATLLGFALTAMSVIIVCASIPQLAVVTEQDGFPDVIAVFFYAIRALGVTTVATLLALFFDRDRTPSLAFFCLVVITSAWATATFIRCVFVFEKVVRLAVSASKARSGDQP